MSITHTSIERVRQVIHAYIKSLTKFDLRVTLDINGQHQRVCYYPQDYTRYAQESMMELHLSVKSDRLKIKLHHIAGKFKEYEQKIRRQIPTWEKITNPHKPRETILEETMS